MNEDQTIEPIACPPAVVWTCRCTAAVMGCLSAWAMYSSAGFYRRGLPGDTTGAAATLVMALMLLASSGYLIRHARQKRPSHQAGATTLKIISFFAFPIGAVAIWGAACFLWDAFVILNHDYIHLGDFGTYTRIEGSSPFSVMMSSFIAFVAFGTLGTFLSWFSVCFFARRSAKAAENFKQPNPYRPPVEAG